MTVCEYILSKAMFSTQLNDAHFIVLASFDSREEKQVNRFIVMQRVVVFFKNGARTNIFFLKAPASICRNGLLVTTGAIFWNTITFKYRHRAKMNDGP